MNLLDRIISIVEPFECLGCGFEGVLLCSGCRNKLETIPSRCYKCHKLTNEFRTCVTCRRSSKLYSIQPRTSYGDISKALVARLKFSGTRSAARIIAETFSFVDLPSDCVLVPVPTATSRVRQRGYDQAKLIAQAFSRSSGAPYLDCLSRSGQTHQVGSRRAQRVKQLKGSYRVKTGNSVQGLHIILIDDVLTTGATLEVAADCLRKNGAERVYGLVFAQA